MARGRGPKMDQKSIQKTIQKWDPARTSQKPPRFSEQRRRAVGARSARGRRAIDARSTRGRSGDFWNQGPPGEVRRGRAPPGKEKRRIYRLSQHASGQRPGELCEQLAKCGAFWVLLVATAQQSYTPCVIPVRAALGIDGEHCSICDRLA